jgi:hypothetical protein
MSDTDAKIVRKERWAARWAQIHNAMTWVGWKISEFLNPQTYSYFVSLYDCHEVPAQSFTLLTHHVHQPEQVVRISICGCKPGEFDIEGIYVGDNKMVLGPGHVSVEAFVPSAADGGGLVRFMWAQRGDEIRINLYNRTDGPLKTPSVLLKVQSFSRHF